ncbi:MAG: metallophosphoesterase [Bdellovibrionaceae bacterium]|nr:metallophosphoesterase [Pseudobdellovibrionaceae bacterium]
MIWCASDIHLQRSFEINNRRFCDWLNGLGRSYPAEFLILLGDIFDLWVGSHESWAQVYPREVEAITSCAQRGIQVLYFQGNHDVAAESFWSKRGVRFIRGDEMMTWNRVQLLFTHGDFINPHEKSYHNYIRWLQGPWASRIAQLMPQPLWLLLGEKASRKSRKYSQKKRQDQESQLEEWFKLYSQEKYKEVTYNYLIAGHIHVRIMRALFPRVWAINLGSWLESSPQVLKISTSGPEFVELDKLLSPT